MSGILVYSAASSLRFSPGNSFPESKKTVRSRNGNARFPSGATSVGLIRSRHSTPSQL
ncbi:BnaA05g26030D [Brassica napus]|uniref:(rape) hypothetical protein n=1 Tax=Brassica napus TaxID=3708 RepID=A0A078I4G5_BRANA|nr:unnamed protein product [Brassica napus]CDY44008.1 BnaA05g26030D [Brassica napus]